MRAKTRLFGEIEIQDDKIIRIEKGIIGFPDLKNFTLIYDIDKEKETAIKWFQSMDEPSFAMPVMDPYKLVPDYAPSVDDEIMENIGNPTDEDTFVLVTVTVPENIENISMNLKAPFVINASNNKGCQVIVDDDYPVKYKIYDLIKDGKKEKAGE